MKTCLCDVISLMQRRLFVILIIWTQSSGAFTDTATVNTLYNRLSSSTELPVIVTINNAIASYSTTSGPADLSRSFARNQDAVLRTLSTQHYHRLKRFDKVPQMAMTVGRIGLSELLSNPTVTVSLDRLNRPFLSESVSRIYPNQNSSLYHGNNEWVVAILDTGVDKTHPFLAGTVVSEACYSDGGGQPGTISLCPSGVSSSTASGSGTPCSASIEGCDHGTQVAGIIAGDGGAFDGVARDSKLIAIKVFSRVNDFDFCFPNLSCLGAYDSDIIAGLTRVYALRNTFKIAAVNLSLGQGLNTGTCDNDPQKPIIDLLKNVNIATVAATGNNGSSNQIASPACISSVIAVGSTFDTSDAVSSFSNNSVALDFYAPGQTITTSTPGGGYSSVQGTSFSAPHVAGAWAVIKHASPNASVNAIESLLDRHGPLISYAGVSRRRIDLSALLNTLHPGVNIVPIIQLLLD